MRNKLVVLCPFLSPTFYPKRLCLTLLCITLLFSGCSLLSKNSFNHDPKNQDPKNQDLDQSLLSPENTLYLNVPVPSKLKQAFDQAFQLSQSGQIEEALASFKRLHMDFPLFSGAAVNIAMLVEDDHPEEAIRYLEEAIHRQNSNYFAINRLGVLKRKAYEFEQAAQLFQKAVQLNKTYSPAWYNLAVVNEVYLGQPEEAIRAYQAYLDLMDVPDPKIQKRIQRLSQ